MRHDQNWPAAKLPPMRRTLVPIALSAAAPSARTGREAPVFLSTSVPHGPGESAEKARWTVPFDALCGEEEVGGKGHEAMFDVGGGGEAVGLGE